jgi:hypothetical protein
MSRQLSGDIFVAGVINQKAVNQNTQQILVLVALQVANIIEAQFGFAENDDSDTIEGIGINVV